VGDRHQRSGIESSRGSHLGDLVSVVSYSGREQPYRFVGGRTVAPQRCCSLRFGCGRSQATDQALHLDGIDPHGSTVKQRDVGGAD
jgi:hypothetical protein